MPRTVFVVDAYEKQKTQNIHVPLVSSGVQVVPAYKAIPRRQKRFLV